MSENNTLNDHSDTNRNNAGKKLSYEKPKLTAVSLFADQVLGTCGKVPPTQGPCTAPALLS
jgi:hypothetical protein